MSKRCRSSKMGMCRLKEWVEMTSELIGMSDERICEERSEGSPFEEGA